MAIKVGGTSIINDDKNISNVGIVTIGASSSGKLNVGSGVTATGDGTLSIAGTFYAFDVVTPLKITNFAPDNNETNVSVDTDIRISFNNSISIGSTGFVYLEDKTGNVDTFGVGSTYISRVGSNTLVITPSSVFTKGLIGIGNTITVVVQNSFIDDTAFTGINTTGSNVTYQFTVETITEGDAYEGGYFICASGGTQWVVAPASSEVSRSWYGRNNAATTAQAVSGCTGWFVPSWPSLQNPGFVCRTYWDCYSCTGYWSANQDPSQGGNSHLVNAVYVGLNDNVCRTGNKNTARCVRAFRCVSY